MTLDRKRCLRAFIEFPSGVNLKQIRSAVLEIHVVPGFTPHTTQPPTSCSQASQGQWLPTGAGSPAPLCLFPRSERMSPPPDEQPRRSGGFSEDSEPEQGSAPEQGQAPSATSNLVMSLCFSLFTWKMGTLVPSTSACKAPAWCQVPRGAPWELVLLFCY